MVEKWHPKEQAVNLIKIVTNQRIDGFITCSMAGQRSPGLLILYIEDALKTATPS